MRISIMDTLRISPILESCMQALVKPSLLWHVPPSDFTDGEGIPFTLNSATAPCYLSSNYPTWTIDPICSLGVCRPSPQQFLEDLKVTIEIDPKNFQKRPMTWPGLATIQGSLYWSRIGTGIGSYWLDRYWIDMKRANPCISSILWKDYINYY